jgi:hypothetical protein
MRRYANRVALLAAGALLIAMPARAQVVSSIQFGAGGFFPRGFDSRASGDVLVRNSLGETIGGGIGTDALVFNISDFRSGHAFGEFNLSFGPHVEVGVGVGTYGRHVPTIYSDVIDTGTNLDISQELSMRATPITALVRFLPFGTASTVQPYVGVGVAAVPFRYAESGDFVDSDTLSIFPARYLVNGTTAGTVVVGGVRFPINGDIYALSVEGRYLRAVGDTGGNANGFVADKIDLSGGMFDVGFIVRF